MSLALLQPLNRPVDSFKGVGPAVKEKLHRLGLEVAGDVLWHLPISVVDRRAMPPLKDAPHQQVISAIIEVVSHKKPPTGRRRIPYRVVCENETGRLELVFFHARGDYLEKQLPVGERRFISGMVEWYHGNLQMSHPDIIAKPEEAAQYQVLEPVYPLTEGLTQKPLRKLIAQVLNECPELPEWQDKTLTAKQGWPDLRRAFLTLHQPLDGAEQEGRAKAAERLAYDELLAHQLALGLTRTRQRARKGMVLEPKGALVKQLIRQLPFALTEGQKEVMQAIANDVTSGERMFRLVQGDVGSGKTVIALLAMLAAVEAGGQAALMAPTEIVSRQHYQWIAEMVAPLGLEVVFLAGSLKQSERKKVRERIAAGEVPLVVGTHALFQKGVEFDHLALAVVDEQHRFGVNQRLALAEKGQHAGTYPHLLFMTATPIPRTLTMALYGDMDVSRLTEKPPGRKPVDTRVVAMSRMDEVLAGIRRALGEGQRAYWVCPLVEESETLTLSSVEDRFEMLKKHFPGKVGLAHGRMSAEDRQKELQRFARGEITVLVATTVIEVGVNVPEATIMVIEHAERFGLSQLHQLRGRVGRGDKAAFCMLLYSDKLSESGKERLKIMRSSEDGFFIAEEDLRLRGAGNVLGTKQSGLPEFHLADPAEHQELLLTARDDVKLILERDETLQSERGQALRHLLYWMKYNEALKYIGG